MRRSSIGFHTRAAIRATLGLCLAVIVAGVLVPAQSAEAALAARRRVNAPRFDGAIAFNETAVFWLGKVDQSANAADVRIGYTDDYLYSRVQIMDRRLWFNPLLDILGWLFFLLNLTPPADWFDRHDAASLYLKLGGNTGTAPSTDAYRFTVELNTCRDCAVHRAAWRGTGSSWTPVTNFPFATLTGWRGNSPNDDVDDRGWWTEFYIPFTSLGLDGPPPEGTLWGLGTRAHDRDDLLGLAPISDAVWPESMTTSSPASWGELRFELPTYSPPTSARGTVTIRQGLNGAVVPDGAVGGGTVCGNPVGPGYFGLWGSLNYAGQDKMNVQNQGDIADWPCFSRYYVTFPLTALPAGKRIVSADLTLYQFGQAGDGLNSPRSLIQVFTIDRDWSELTLNWNNSPYARENVARTWVDPIGSLVWPGVPRSWNVSAAAAEAYAGGVPLRLALYSADEAQHSGRYFSTSNTGDWNAVGRPTLEIKWGD